MCLGKDSHFESRDPEQPFVLPFQARLGCLGPETVHLPLAGRASLLAEPTVIGVAVSQAAGSHLSLCAHLVSTLW